MVNKLNLFVLGPEPEEGCGRESLDEEFSDIMGGGREDTLMAGIAVVICCFVFLQYLAAVSRGSSRV